MVRQAHHVLSGSRILSVSEAAKIVKKGGVVAYPTETVYGLGADPKNRAALKKIFKIKGRGKGKPILILISSPRELKKWVVGVGERERKLIRAFWPGPLTLVFTARKSVLKELTGGTGKIGVRISSNRTAQRLCRLVGGALTSTSANFSGRPPLAGVREVEEQLGESIDGVVRALNFKKLNLISSTVLDISESKFKVLREGKITKEKLIHAAF